MMGRGNVCTHKECEGLYYLDRDLLDVYSEVEKCNCGHIFSKNTESEPMTARELSDAGIDYDYDGLNTGWAYDSFESNMKWKEMICILSERLRNRFKSFRTVDAWRERDKHVVLQNAYFEIAVADGDWCAAWCLLERKDVDTEGRNRTLMQHHCRIYLEAIKTILVDVWGEAIGYGGAWTHGTKYTKGNVV